jgi:hypothetical protein
MKVEKPKMYQTKNHMVSALPFCSDGAHCGESDAIDWKAFGEWFKREPEVWRHKRAAWKLSEGFR